MQPSPLAIAHSSGIVPELQFTETAHNLFIYCIAADPVICLQEIAKFLNDPAHPGRAVWKVQNAQLVPVGIRSQLAGTGVIQAASYLVYCERVPDPAARAVVIQPGKE